MLLTHKHLFLATKGNTLYQIFIRKSNKKSYCNSLKKQSSELKKTNINKYKGDDLFEIKFNGRGKNSTYGRRKK